MAVVVEMPKLSDTMEEGGIASWLKSEGDAVEEGEALLEIETDKATMEYASPEEGVLLKILANPGQTVALNAPIAVIGSEGEKVDFSKLLSSHTPSQEKPKASEGVQEVFSEKSVVASDRSDVATVDAGALSSPQDPQRRVKSSPLARKKAKELGIDLQYVKGSGPSGRIIVKDVNQASTTGAARINVQPQSRHQDERLPLTMMRKTIAKRLTAAKNDAPHFYLTASANMENLMAWRARLNKDYKQGTEQVKVSVNDLILMAVGRALRKHPQVNVSWQNDHILQHGGVHVCMAVALPTGLVTPVIRNIDLMGVRQIAFEAKELGKRAHEGLLANEDYQGGTFTVSNLGMTVVEEFTAIINPPQACILAVGRTQARPWVDETGTIVVQSRMKMTLSSDHRVVDGMVGAQFLQTLVCFLEDPLMMLESIS
ncbi:MAG: dihydrolipoamide acetyltransferase family protein [Bdellovibrionota bacterium]